MDVPDNDKIILQISILLTVVFFGLGWYWQGRENSYDLYQVPSGYESSRNAFILRSAEVSARMADSALQELKKKHVKQAIEDCKVAINVLPINANPYILLTKFYLMTGQEQQMFDTLTMAGRSFPDFNSIVNVIDDDDLQKIPLDHPQSNIYLARFPENKKMAVSFMFDDGEADVYRALPTFEKYGYRATIPVIAGFVAGTTSNTIWGSWAQWRDAANRGFEIANHSMYHRDVKELHGKDLEASIDQAQALIEKNTGHPVTAYVFPYDSFSDESINRALRFNKVVRALKFLRLFYNRTVKIVYGGPFFSVATANRLVDIGIKRRLWIVAECHGVRDKKSDLTFKPITPEFLDNHLAYIHSKSDMVWVDTFSNVFQYLFLRSHTTIGLKGLTADSMDFILHNDKMSQMPAPLTVVLKPPQENATGSAIGEDGRALKAWPCGNKKLCVDVTSYDKIVHVQWQDDRLAMGAH